MKYNTIDDIVNFIDEYYVKSERQELIKEAEIAEFIKQFRRRSIQ